MADIVLIKEISNTKFSKINSDSGGGELFFKLVCVSIYLFKMFFVQRNLLAKKKTGNINYRLRVANSKCFSIGKSCDTERAPDALSTCHLCIKVQRCTLPK